MAQLPARRPSLRKRGLPRGGVGCGSTAVARVPDRGTIEVKVPVLVSSPASSRSSARFWAICSGKQRAHPAADLGTTCRLGLAGSEPCERAAQLARRLKALRRIPFEGAIADLAQQEGHLLRPRGQSSLVTAMMVATCVSRSNRRSPLKASRKHTPSDQMSARRSTSIPRACSGAMYA